MFGSVNALFSGLALFGIIISILIQQSELNLQRKELIETREEFKTTRLTNILFKQVEYLNTIINNVNLSGQSSLTNFVAYLEIYDQRNESYKVNRVLNENSRVISGLISKVIPILENFDNVLLESGIKNSETSQLKSIFASNINPHFRSLLSFEIQNIAEKLKKKNKITDIEIELLKITLKRIEYIISY